MAQELGSSVLSCTQRKIDLSEYPRFLTREQVAELLRVDIRTVDRLRAEGGLDSIKVGSARCSRVLFDRNNVARFLSEAPS